MVFDKNYRFLIDPTPFTDSRTWGEPIYSTDPTAETVASNRSLTLTTALPTPLLRTVACLVLNSSPLKLPTPERLRSSTSALPAIVTSPTPSIATANRLPWIPCASTLPTPSVFKLSKLFTCTTIVGFILPSFAMESRLAMRAN